MEITLAIPAPNEREILTNNLAVQGLIIIHLPLYLLETHAGNERHVTLY